MMQKVALITGITGQDGAYLAEYLLEQGYRVHGIKRRSSLFNTERVDHLYQDPHEQSIRFSLHYGDLTDTSNIVRIIQETQPDEIYNLGAQSHVQVSFETPEYTAQVDAVGTLRILEAIRILGLQNRTRFYQASTSELFGKVRETPQTETTPFYPRSPYAAAKLYAYWITVNYRESYGIFASNGILFNHESPVRGETFVTRKITRAATRIALGLQDKVYLGNLDARRDWGHAKDYVRAMHAILSHDAPDDFVVATGITTSIRDFATKVFNKIGISVRFSGNGVDEVGVVSSVDSTRAPAVSVGSIVIAVDKRYFRPAEVDLLQGDSSKIRNATGWKPRYTLDALIDEMVQSDMQEAQRELLLSNNNFRVRQSRGE